MLIQTIPEKILIIKLRKLGDVLGTTPVTRQLRNLFPNAQIAFLTEPLGANVYEHSKNIDQLIILSRKPTILEFYKLLFNIRRQKFDLVIDLYDHPKTAFLTWFSNAPYRLGYAKKVNTSFFYTYCVTLSLYEKINVNRIHHQLKLTEALGTSYEDDSINFEIDEASIRYGENFASEHKFGYNTIAFCVQSERSFAQVPETLLVSIANYLINNELKLYFVYGPGEKASALNILKQVENQSECIIDYAMPSIAQVKAILSHCLLFVGNDSGNKHLAVAAGIPTISLFYGDNPLVWTPDEPASHRFIQTENARDSFNEFKEIFGCFNQADKQFG